MEVGSDIAGNRFKLGIRQRQPAARVRPMLGGRSVSADTGHTVRRI